MSLVPKLIRAGIDPTDDIGDQVFGASVDASPKRDRQVVNKGSWKYPTILNAQEKLRFGVEFTPLRLVFDF